MTIQDQLNEIIDDERICAVQIWKHHSGWLGCFYDARNKMIPGSTPWKPCPSLEALVDKLVEMADTYRRERV